MRTDDVTKRKYMINIGRPSYYTNEDFKNWSAFFDYVEESDILIGVNAIYYDMKQMCKARQGYGGNGFQFCFWFDAKEDRKQFLKDLENKLGWRPYRHCEKVCFYTPLDGETCLRMIPDLLKPAIEHLEENNITRIIDKDEHWNFIKVNKSDIKWLVKLDEYLNELLLDMD